MKLQSVFFVFLFLISTVLKAQPQKDTWMIGGSTNLLGNIHQLGTGSLSPNNNLGLFFGKYKRKFGGNEISNVSSVVFNVTPTFGNMLTNKSMLGLSTGIFYFSRKSGNSDATSLTLISATPFFRYYGGKFGSVFPYLELKAGGAGLFFGGDSDFGGILGGKVALSYFMKSKIALDIFADYTYALNEDQGNSGVFGFGVGFSLFK